MQATPPAPTCLALSRKFANACMRHMAWNSRTRSFYGSSDGREMSTGPEVYPPEALADDEPRYLRRQKPLEIRRRKFGRKSWPAYRRWTFSAAGIAAAGFVGYYAIRFLLFSPSVEFAGSYQVETTGNQFVGRAALTDVFSPDLGKSILRVPLDARRKEIESIPWVGE